LPIEFARPTLPGVPSVLTLVRHAVPFVAVLAGVVVIFDTHGYWPDEVRRMPTNERRDS
jgi:hypothetical protein